MSTLKRYNGTSWETISGTVTGDTLPIGTEVEYDGATVPAGWEQVADPYNYSKTEQVKIGKWFDGNNLYRVVVDTTTPSSSSVSSIASIAGLNYNRITNLYGMLYTSSQCVPLNWLYTTNEINSLYVEGNNVMCKITSSSYQNKTCYVVIEYTKSS